MAEFKKKSHILKILILDLIYCCIYFFVLNFIRNLIFNIVSKNQKKKNYAEYSPYSKINSILSLWVLNNWSHINYILVSGNNLITIDALITFNLFYWYHISIFQYHLNIFDVLSAIDNPIK